MCVVLELLIWLFLCYTIQNFFTCIIWTIQFVLSFLMFIFFGFPLLVAISSFAGILGECSSIPRLRFFFFQVEISSCALISLFRPKMSPQWLSELRRL